jgi:TolA-binding protein
MTLDPLGKLLQAADDPMTPPPADLADRVRGRIKTQRKRARAIRSVAAVAIALAALVGLRVTVRNKAAPLDAAQIAQLRSEADQLAARAAALERQVRLAQTIRTRQQLRSELDRLTTLARDDDPVQTAVDRAASIAVTEGDFSLEVRGDREDARAAYQRTIECFPNSLWAAVARARIKELNMN